MKEKKIPNSKFQITNKISNIKFQTHPNPLLKREGTKRKNVFFLFILLLAILMFLLFEIAFIISSKREGQQDEFDWKINLLS